MAFRRRRLPSDLAPAFAAFEALISPLERAKSALTAAVPRTRLPGRPLADALSEFEEELGAVRSGMEAWRVPEVEEVWRGASERLGEAMATAERVRVEASAPDGFEALIGLVGELLAPLDAFRAAADRFRELRA